MTDDARKAADADFDLVRRAQSGDYDAFELLVAKYERRVYALAMGIVRQREEAEDLVQKTFLSVIENIKDFRGEALFSTWLMRIAGNHALKALRKKRGLITVPLEAAKEDDYEELPRPEFISHWSNSPEEIVGRRETQRILAEALDELDEKYRTVFLLRDIEGFSTEETAEALSISAANVKVRLLRARLALRERLTRQFGDESKRLFKDHAHE